MGLPCPMVQLQPLPTVLTEHFRPLPIGLGPLPKQLASFLAAEVSDPAPMPSQPQAHPQIASAGPVRMDNGGSYDMLVYTGPMMQFAPLQKTGQLVNTTA